MKQSHITRTLFSVTGLIILTKLLGFVKQMVVAGTFGATIETDLINLSQGFIGDIQYVLVQTLLTAFVSVYIYTAGSSEEDARQFTADTVKAFSLIAAVLAGLTMLASPIIARIIAPSYSPERSAMLAGYLRLFAPVLMLFVWSAVFQALLNANKRFVPGEMIGFFQSVWIIALILLLSSRFGIRTLVWSFFAYAIWNVLFLGTLSRPYWRLMPGNPYRNPAVRELLGMIGPLLLGYSLVYINQQVDKILVSGLGDGAVTALIYGAVLSNLVSTFIVSFASILFSYVTMRIAHQEHKIAAELSNRSAVLLIAAFLPVSIITIICARDIVSVAFGRGAFEAEAVATASLALSGYGFSFVPLILREVYSRVQYGYQDTKRPMVNSSIGIVCNIVLSVALCPRFGVLGVAFASSVSVAVCGILNVLSARRHSQYLHLQLLARSFPWLIAGGLACGTTVVLTSRLLAETGSLLRVLVCALCGFFVYVLVTAPLLLRLIRDQNGRFLFSRKG